MAKIDELRDRYFHDPVFARYVDGMRAAIRELHLGPGEIRDAAMLASYIETERLPPESIRFPHDPRQGDVFECRYCGKQVDFLKRYHSDERGLWHWECGR